MPFQKGNKLGMKKASEYEDMDEGESTGDEEVITVPFVSQYPEGRVDMEAIDESSGVPDSQCAIGLYEELKDEIDAESGVHGPEKPEHDDLYPPTIEDKGVVANVREAIQRLPGLGVKLMFHGALKDEGGRNIQRPIPQVSRHVDKRDFVRIGPDRIGVFTKDEAEYLLRVCKGAFTKAEE